MNIAYLTGSRIPSRTADSVHAMKICAALAAQGNTVELIVPEYADTEPGAESVFEYYGVAESFKIEKIRLRAPGIPVLKGLRRSFAAARYIKKDNYECIYGRDYYACFFIAYIYRKPVYYEYHAPVKPDTLAGTTFRFLVKKNLSKKTVVITEALKQWLISQQGFDGEQILVAPDGADLPPGDITPAELVSTSDGKFHVGYIGHLYKGRGLELLGEMAHNCPYAFFHIIGGNERDINYWKDKYSQITNIHFYGFVPPAQTVSYGKCMDALIAPYQHVVSTEGSSKAEDSTAKWMSPMKIFEYMALGKPIVSSDLPALREVLTDGENAVLCAPDDAAQWCRAIGRLYEDKGFSKRLADGALTSLGKYTWNARAKNILEFILDDAASDSDNSRRASFTDKFYFLRMLRVALLFMGSYLSRVTFLSSTR